MQMSSKHYCDICGKEMDESYIILGESVPENICDLFMVANIEDCCNGCYDIINNQNYNDAVLSALKTICIPKPESQLEKDFMHWFVGLSWVEQQRVFNKLKTTFKLIEGGDNIERTTSNAESTD